MISMLSGQLLYVTILLAGGINVSQPRRQEEKRDSSTSTSTAQTCKQCLTMFGTEGGKGAFLLCTLHFKHGHKMAYMSATAREGPEITIMEKDRDQDKMGRFWGGGCASSGECVYFISRCSPSGNLLLIQPTTTRLIMWS